MKKTVSFILCLFIALLSSYSLFAQEYEEHVVARGETVSSIAKTYNITESTLIEANPMLKNYCYVGMKIRIPVLKENNTFSVVEDLVPQIIDTVSNGANMEAEVTKTVSDWQSRPFNTGLYDFRVGIIPSTSYTSSSNFIMSAGIAHFFDKSLYLAAQLGYGSSSSSTGVGDAKIEADSHYLMLPIELGYSLWLYKPLKGVAIAPYVGADISYLVKATMKQGSNKTTLEPEKHFGINAKLGLKLHIFGGFALNAGYSFDNNGDYLFVGLGCIFF